MDKYLTLASALLFSHFGPILHAQIPPSPLTHTSAQQERDATPWWKQAVFYEVYPRSYGDTNGDGIGDLNGITEHLDYLQHLGIGAIWIAPFYPSPQVDFGYDISNHQDVDPQFGTLADFDRLAREAKSRGMRVVVDMVLNHTSDQHQWFKDSASSHENSKANWYIWNDGFAVTEPGVTAYQKRYEHDGKVPPTTGSQCSAARPGNGRPSENSSIITISTSSSPT